MISFNVPPRAPGCMVYMQQAINNNKICGDGEFTKKCNKWLENITGASKALLTTSCTHALEMAAILCDIEPGDEVIMPSYTFVSTANAFVLRGAKIVFVDIRPDTMNIDENLIEDAITENTRVIVPMHYAGVICDMDKILNIARSHGLYVVEDAAQAVMSQYNGHAAGSMGNFGCYSFHETKNYSMGEGGALLISDAGDIERAEIIREKGTNRSMFWRGQVDKYTWIDTGSSYLPSELNAAYLLAQFDIAHEINEERLRNWNSYYSLLKPLADQGFIEIPYIPAECKHNAHMFYVKAKDIEERTRLIEYLKKNGINCVFHYVPLHSSPAGRQFGVFHGEDKYTTRESERLMRLPMYYGLTEDEIVFISDAICSFYKS